MIAQIIRLFFLFFLSAQLYSFARQVVVSVTMVTVNSELLSQAAKKSISSQQTLLVRLVVHSSTQKRACNQRLDSISDNNKIARQLARKRIKKDKVTV